MKKTILILSAILLTLILNAQNVNIPDANFKAALVADISINTNMDAEIQVSEAVAFTGTIDVSNQNISSLQGIEAFINMYLLSCGNNYLTNGLVLDGFNSLYGVSCINNALDYVSISNCNAFQNLDCYNNQIIDINITNCPSFKGLNAADNLLTSLDLSTYGGMTWLVVDNNQLTSIDVSDKASFVELSCASNNLSYLNVKNGNNTNFLYFYAHNNPGLTCIEVDDAVWSTTNWVNGLDYHFDPQSYFSNNCSFNLSEIHVDVLCYGDNNGSIDLTVNGGSMPFSYSWTGPVSYSATTEDINNLAPGDYYVTVTDANTDTRALNVTILEPDLISITTTNITNTCSGQCDGTITVSVSGGTPIYSYNWNNGIQLCVVSNLCPGTYTVTVTDAAGCTNSLPVIISGFPQITGLNEVITDATCGLSNGSIDITVSNGAPPYTYLWSNAATSEDLSLISTGTYSVTVTDVNGCTYTDSFNVQNIAGPTSSITSQTNVLCNGNYDGTAVVAGSGGTTPYTYLWDANTGNQTTDTAINLCAGNYSVTVTDNIGCSSISIVTITEPSVLNIFNDSITNTTHGICNGSIDFSAVGGVPPYDYFWSTGDTTNTLDMLCPESYDITITDSNGCIFQTSFHVGSSYDSSYTFVDTIYVQIDTCIFNNTLPVDSALIYNYSTISQDSVLLNWVFWQDGNSILLDIGVHIDTPGSNLVYLEIDCGTKAQFAYEFYGVVDIITNLSGHKQELPDVNIYPNPTTGKITIEAEGIRNIKLLNIEGRKIYSGVDHEIDISKESKGIFIIIVTTDTGFTVRKIILE